MLIGFKGFHPLSALMFFIYSFFVSLTATNPVLLLMCFIAAALYDIKLQGKNALSYIFKFLLPMIFAVAAVNSLFNHYGVTILFIMKSGNNFTAEAMVYGFVSGVRLSSMLLWLDIFNEIVTEDKIIYLFGRFSPRIALIISMTLRFIPLIRKQSAEIIKAEKGIGNSVASNEKLFSKMKVVSRRLSILVSWTLERGIDTSNSMKARGYGIKGRTFYSKYSLLIKDAVMLLILLCAFSLTLLFKESISATFNPEIYIAPVSVCCIALLLLNFSVFLMPMIIDLKEEKKWQYLK